MLATASPEPGAQFTSRDIEESFFIVEGLLCDLEKEFDAKVKAEKPKKRKVLRYRINRQVMDLK